MLRDSKRIRSKSARDSAACSSAWSALFLLDAVFWAMQTTSSWEDPDPDGSDSGIKVLSETQRRRRREKNVDIADVRDIQIAKTKQRDSD